MSRGASGAQGAGLKTVTARSADERLLSALERLVFGGRLYRLTLSGIAPPPLRLNIPYRPAGDARVGAAILRGSYALMGEQREAEDPWTAGGGEAWRRALEGFGWLADLRALGSDAARARARDLVDRWIELHGDWSAGAWRGDVLAQRIAAWLGEHDFFCASADDLFRARVFRSLGGQLRHLDRLARLGGRALGPPGERRIAALASLALAYAVLPGRPERLTRALALLLQECDRQVLPDGGHYQRSPLVQLDVLRELVGLRAVLLAGKQPVPQALQTTIDRMAPMLRFFRHGDGRLALFNGADEGDASEIDGLLARADAAGKAPGNAPYSGFQRMTAERSLVILDSGPPPPEGEGDAHAGCLSFELSVGPERLIVNCGARRHPSPEWHMAQRATAAHSTLVLAGTNSAELLPAGGLGHRPRHVHCRREEADRAVFVDASHDGYAKPFGVLHRRWLYLAPLGEDLRGEDWLTRVRPGPPLPFAIRFHLHPEVRASLVHDGSAAILRLPSGAGFRFDAAGGQLSLSESIYLGERAAARRSEQLVVESNLAGEQADVKWSIRRIDAEG
jgi:uncharacterized heparinase superfamily protein